MRIIILLFSLLLTATCRKETLPQNQFACENYNYFDRSTPYIYNQQDSIKLVNYLLKSKRFKNDTARIKYLFSGLSAYIPTRILGNVDTVLFDKYFLPEMGYKNFDHNNTISLIVADAVFVGEVVSVLQVKDTSRCLFYKTLYSIRVDKVLHSYFKLKKGDIIVAGDIMGYSGGCTPGEDYIDVFTDFPEYHKGSKGIFLPSHNAYDMTFISRVKYNNTDYADDYCPNFFRLLQNFYETDLNDKNIQADIKSLFNN